MPRIPIIPPEYYDGTPVPWTLARSTRLWRVHPQDRRPHLFIPPKDDEASCGRFDNPIPDGYPYVYLSLKPDTALAEVALRDVPFGHRDHRFVKAELIRGKRASAVRNLADLRLISLVSTRHLAAVCAGEWLSHGDKEHYPDTRRWARWLRKCDPEAQGLVWDSRRDSAEQAIILFGDRIEPGVLRPFPWEINLDDHAGIEWVNAMLEPYRASVELPPS